MGRRRRQPTVRQPGRLLDWNELRAAFDIWYCGILLAVETSDATAAIDVEAMAGETPPTGYRSVTVSESARWGLVDGFLQSPEAVGLTGAELLVRCAIDYKLDWADGDPLRWSPEIVTDFLHDWLPWQEMAVVTAATPAHLRAWVRYAGRLAGLYPAYVEATAAAVTGGPGPALRPITGR